MATTRKSDLPLAQLIIPKSFMKLTVFFNTHT